MHTPPIITKFLFCILISALCCNASATFRTTCQESEFESTVKWARENNPRMRLDIEFISFSGETDAMKMMRKFTKGFMDSINELNNQYSRWNGYWVPMRETKRGLQEVCRNYDEEYKEAFPYGCYTKQNWCLLEELFGNLLEQMGTIWQPRGPTLILSQPWYGFFNPPDHDWTNTLINEMKMACEIFFHHPSLGPMTKDIRDKGVNLKTRIINRIYYYVETNQHENIEMFFQRFEWVKQPFLDASVDEGDVIISDISRLLKTVTEMLKDTDSFNWRFSLPVPRTREVVAMLWLVVPKRVRDLFPLPVTNTVPRERVMRFLQLTFDNTFEKNTEMLTSLLGYTENLKKQVTIDCSEKLNEDMDGLECEFSKILEDVAKLLELVKAGNWRSSKTLDLRSAILISFLSTGTKDLIEVPFAKLREIILDVFERFYGYAKKNEVDGLQKYMELMPPAELLNLGTERGCTEFFSDLKAKIPCMFQNVFREILLYMNSLKVAPLNTKIISTTYNFRDKLRGAQLSAISAQIDQRAIETKTNLVEFANELKTFISEESSERFAALEGYFKGIADFDQRKANADIGYIAGRLKSFDNEVQKLKPIVEEKMTAVVTGAVASAVAHTIQKGVEMVVKSIFACNAADPDPGAVFDAINEFAQSIVTLTRTAKLADTFQTAFKQTSSVASRLNQNNEFIKSVREIIKTLPSLLQNNAEFSEMTTEFLTKYSDYDPKVQRQEITKVGTDWESFIGEACETLYAGDSALPAIVQGTFAGRGDCITTQGDISQMMEIYSEVYDYQFDLMETLAIAVRAYQSQFFANRLDTHLRVLSEREIPDESEDEAVSLNQAMLSFYLIYRIHTLQIVVQHCNYLQFKNAGEMPSPCITTMRTLEQRDISNLIAFQPESCTPESFKFVDIPTTNTDGTAGGWINITKLYKGEEVPFKIPDFDWLVKNKWITRSDASDTAIYLSTFELFLPPNQLGRKKKSRQKAFHKVEKRMANVGDSGVRFKVFRKPANQRSDVETREIQFRTTAKYPAPLFPGENALRFNLQPYRRFVFTYQENSQSCRLNTIDNPYSSSLPKICLISTPPRETQVDPSIFSLWKIKLQSHELVSAPHGDEGNSLMAAVRMCKVKKPSTLSKRKVEDATKKDSH